MIKWSLGASGIQELPLLAGNQTMSPHAEGTGKQEPITLIKKNVKRGRERGEQRRKY